MVNRMTATSNMALTRLASFTRFYCLLETTAVGFLLFKILPIVVINNLTARVTNINAMSFLRIFLTSSTVPTFKTILNAQCSIHIKARNAITQCNICNNVFKIKLLWWTFVESCASKKRFHRRFYKFYWFSQVLFYEKTWNWTLSTRMEFFHKMPQTIYSRCISQHFYISMVTPGKSR